MSGSLYKQPSEKCFLLVKTESHDADVAVEKQVKPRVATFPCQLVELAVVFLAFCRMNKFKSSPGLVGILGQTQFQAAVVVDNTVDVPHTKVKYIVDNEICPVGVDNIPG